MIGNILLTLALAASIFTVLMYYLDFKGYVNAKLYARLGVHTTTILVIAASVLLFHAILTHQYQYKYVYEYSGSGLSTGLLLSTFWAGQQGSFMLWVFFSVMVGLVLLDYTSKRDDLETRVMMVYMLVVFFLLILVNPTLKSPFNYIWVDPVFIDLKNINHTYISMPFMRNFIFTDTTNNQSFVKMSSELYAILHTSGIPINEFIVEGKGLNPLLQNFWMQIHPPFLFVGFAMSAVPYSFAIAALIKNDYKDWVKQSFPWLLGATMVLGLAIMLGGYWAYGVLGWGGYWGWDPVENSSLIPWIIGAAAIHTFLIQKRYQAKGGNGRFVKTNLILSIMMFILVLYSTFLTRSGILGDSSVHSFVAPGMLVYLFLIILMLTFLFIGLIGLAIRWKYLEKFENFEDNFLSRELALFTGSVALIASAIIILVGTSAPIWGQAVEIRFYNELNLPIAIIIGFLNAFSLLLSWKLTKGKSFWKRTRTSLILSVILSAVIIIFGKIDDLMLAIMTFSSVFTLVVNLEIMLKIIKDKALYTGAYVAHTGLALFMLGVIATGGFTKEKQIELEKGKPVKAFGYEMTFLGYKPIENGKKFAFNVQLKSGDEVEFIAPVMYRADFNNSLMREPDILNMWTKDFYVTPLSYSTGEDEHTHNGSKFTLKEGEEVEFKGKIIKFVEFNFPKSEMEKMRAGGDFTIGAKISVNDGKENYEVEPKLITVNGKRSFEKAVIENADLKIELIGLNAGTIDITLSSLDETPVPQKKVEKFTIEASIKPFIGLVWLGVIITVLGFAISIVRRMKET